MGFPQDLSRVDPTTFTRRLQAVHGMGRTPTNGWFECPLISEIDESLWLGGCIDGVRLPDDFRYVVSLYPWEKYALGPQTTRWEYPMYDDLDEDTDQVDEIAARVNELRASGKTLVHCQAGLNRSGLVAARALMLEGASAANAIGLLRERRDPMVLCNPAFEHWLKVSEIEDRVP